ncbi:YopX family protein [Paenibacillus sp. MBLB4367]|uniref:YopX family protein n=1 Tax=Paenibacillus sp. MBLB4367 TaxID=3384767 RepID=UPI003907FA2F
MREYKFRGLAISEQGSSCLEKWVNGNLIKADNGDSFIVHWQRETAIGYMTTIWQIKPETVGQYSGVHDSEDAENELYHGDIVEVEIDKKVVRCKVHYEAPGFMLVSDELDDGYEWISDRMECDRNFIWIPNSKLIGNIYEHPHLLKE